MKDDNRIVTETFVETNGEIVTHIRYTSSALANEKAEMLRRQIKAIEAELEMFGDE